MTRLRTIEKRLADLTGAVIIIGIGVALLFLTGCVTVTTDSDYEWTGPVMGTDTSFPPKVDYTVWRKTNEK